MTYRICFPDGKQHAFTLSYDDNQIYDRRLVELFNKYNLKATFHINSGNLDESNEYDSFISGSELSSLYSEHEVACHGVTHPYFSQLPNGLIAKEILDDRIKLEELSSKIVRGMSYPFGEYSDRLIAIASSVGIEYSRTVESTQGFNLPADFMKWHPTCHHNDASKHVSEFLDGPSYRDLALFYVWGHSFEFERQNTWDMMEDFCQSISGHDFVWYATNIEIKDYIVAARSLVTSADQSIIYNPSAIDVFISYEGNIVKIEKCSTVHL